MNYYANNITMIKGNSFSHALVATGLGQEFESIYFTCRDSLNDDSNILFEKSLNNGITLVSDENDERQYIVRIDPEDTEGLQAGTYFYDEQVAVNGEVLTIMRGNFTIRQNATRKTTPSPNPYEAIEEYLDYINGEVI